jgi:cytochrome P450
MINGEDVSESTIHQTIFSEVLQSDLPPQEKTIERMADEAQTILGGGIETTTWALSIASFHIINTPSILSRLREELLPVLPFPTSEPDWQKLEKLPYLTACIQEAVRLSYGISHRNPRVSRTALEYKTWVIPAGTPVSMTVADVHHDEELFPDSYSYVPERWLDNPRTRDGSSLSRYFVAFGKDARSCLGVK